MNWKGWLVAAAVAGGALYIWSGAGSPFAASCIHREEDRNWSFLTFYNRCDKPINAVFCNKMTMGEIGKWFGYKTGEWDCRNHHVQPGSSFATIKWVNEQSSVASHLLSTSRYVVAACKSPYTPQFTEGSQYKCVK